MAARRRLGARPGFTLLEMLVSMSLLSIATAFFFGAVARVQKQYRDQRGTLTAEDGLRSAELVLRTVLQAAGADPMGTHQGLLHPDPLGNGVFDNLRVRSDFNPADGDFADELEDFFIKVVADTLLVQWQAGGSFTPLAYPVHSVSFTYFDNSGTPLTTVAAVAGAMSVRFTINAPESPVSTTLRSRHAWVFLQNRR
jgi:prepilin-type N-terminal cleavage/methylation domain-containing protein